MNIIYSQFISLEAYNSSLGIQANTLEIYTHFVERVWGCSVLAVQGIEPAIITSTGLQPIWAKYNNNKHHWSFWTHPRIIICTHYYHIFHYLKHFSEFLQERIVCFLFKKISNSNIFDHIFLTSNIQIRHKTLVCVNISFLSTYICK